MKGKSLNVLVLGCLGPNQNRILSLAKKVNSLIYAYSEFNVSQIPFTDIVQVALPRRNMSQLLEYLIIRYEINVIYSLLNSHDGSTEATIEIIDSGLKIPIVRHYKEHPCFPTIEEKRALTETTGQIYINQESFNFFHSVYQVPPEKAHFLDADMISEKYMTNQFQKKLSDIDNRPHLLVAGSLSTQNDRLDMRELCIEMAKRDVCVHLYGHIIKEESNSKLLVHDKESELQYKNLVSTYDNISLHPFITPELFTHEWSKYDAGFMHASVPSTHPTAQFENMNMPYRYSAYICAGLPLCLPDKGQSSMKRFIKDNGIGFSFEDYDELAMILHDKAHLASLTERVIKDRTKFSFEFSLNALLAILSKYAQ